MQSKNLKIFSKKDWEKAKTRMERIYMKMMQPKDFELNNSEDMYYRLLKKTWTLLDQFSTPKLVIKRLMEQEELSYFQCAVAIKDAQELLGPILKTNKDYERAIVREKAMNLYNKCIEKGDLKQAAAALGVYTKASGLDKDDNEGGFEIPSVPVPVFSSNAELNSGESEEMIEDAEIIENED